MNVDEEEKKKGMRMIASQNFFYAGENGIKYMVEMNDENISRSKIIEMLKIKGFDFMPAEKMKEVIKLYLLLLPKKDGGKGFRNKCAYRGLNSRFYEAHKKFAETVVKIIENE